MELNFSYYPCQTCKERTNCDKCSEKLKAKLLALAGVDSAEVNIPKKLLNVQGSIDEDDLVDFLENTGVFVD